MTEGGGVYCFYQCRATIRNNVITDNEAICGAGIASLYSSPNIYGNTIVNNRAVRGGAMHIEGASPQITGNTFCGNSATEGGGAISCLLAPDVRVKNCILWGDKASMGDEILIDYGAVLTISYSAIPPGSSSVFIMPWGGILHWEDGMIETDPRLYQEARDMGADEFHPHLYFLGDPVPGGRIMLHAVGEPLSSGLKLLRGNRVRVPPLQTAYGDFYLTLPLAGIFKLGRIPR